MALLQCYCLIQEWGEGLVGTKQKTDFTAIPKSYPQVQATGRLGRAEADETKLQEAPETISNQGKIHMPMPYFSKSESVGKKIQWLPHSWVKVGGRC